MENKCKHNLLIWKKGEEKYKIEDYSNKVKLQVGQRVELDLPEVPVEDRDVTTGVIERISTMFTLTSSHRKIIYTMRFDGNGNYIKEDRRITKQGIQQRITLDNPNRFKIILKQGEISYGIKKSKM